MEKKIGLHTKAYGFFLIMMLLLCSICLFTGCSPLSGFNSVNGNQQEKDRDINEDGSDEPEQENDWEEDGNSGVQDAEGSENLLKTMEASKTVTGIKLSPEALTVLNNFSLCLFRENMDAEKNSLLSPFSVISALAMTANGARGDTLSEMEDVFGLPIGTLNEACCIYRNSLPYGEKYQVSIANSIWFRTVPDFTVKQEFLQENVNWFDAGIYQSAFDSSTISQMNSWVNLNTNGMIPTIIDNIPEEAMMYLINAIAFDARWENPYPDAMVRDAIFTTAGGEKQNVQLMYSTEKKYLEDEQARGFIRYYADSSYAFAALLPNEGVSLEDYLASLTGEKLSSLLTNPDTQYDVKAAIPKFEQEYSYLLNESLYNLGIRNAFDKDFADFSGISAESPLVIDTVLHKTFITIDEKGTKAAAVTSVGMMDATSLPVPKPVQTVYLDRPFLYLLIDCENNLPIFIGSIRDITTE